MFGRRDDGPLAVWRVAPRGLNRTPQRCLATGCSGPVQPDRTLAGHGMRGPGRSCRMDVSAEP